MDRYISRDVTFTSKRYFRPSACFLAVDGFVEDLDDVGAFGELVACIARDGDVDVVVSHVRVDRLESVVDVLERVTMDGLNK